MENGGREMRQETQQKLLLSKQNCSIRSGACSCMPQEVNYYSFNFVAGNR